MSGFEIEVELAAAWLADGLLPESSPLHDGFVASVKAELEERYTGHWYPDEAHRGCAFRSLTCNGTLDPLLVRALKRASMPKTALKEDAKMAFILWVNPGEVKVNDAGAKSHIYCAGAAPNPYSKAKVRFEPTRLNVCASEDGSSSKASSPKTSPKASPTLSPKADKFVPETAPSSSSSENSSDSEGEEAQPPAGYMLPQAYPAAFAPPPGLFMPGQMPGWQMAPQMMPHPQSWPAGSGWQQHAPYGSYAVEAH